MWGSGPFLGHTVVGAPGIRRAEGRGWGPVARPTNTAFRRILAGPAEAHRPCPHRCVFHWGSGNRSPCRSKKGKLCGSRLQLQIQTVQPRGPSLRGNSMNLSGN